MSQSLEKSSTSTSTSTQIDYILLDCSSSMTYQWTETLQSIDAYISTTRLHSIPSRVIFHPFYSSNPDYVHLESPIADCPSISENPISPMGQTSLYDAINAMGRRLAALDPPRASILIVTDGDDNYSRTEIHQARAVLNWLRHKGWQITFIGADFSNAAQARLLGANPAEAIGVQRSLLSNAARALAEKRARYGETGADIHFSPDEQQQFGGYLASPSSSN